MRRWRLLRLFRHLLSCRLNGLDDMVVACATADRPRDALADFRVRRLRVLAEKLHGTEEHSGSAESALERVLIPKGLLERVELPPLRQTFDGGDLGAIGLDGKHETGTDGRAVYQHRAASADAVLATHVSPGEAEALAEKIGQQQTGLDGAPVPDPVDPQPPPPGPLRRRGYAALSPRLPKPRHAPPRSDRFHRA